MACPEKLAMKSVRSILLIIESQKLEVCSVIKPIKGRAMPQPRIKIQDLIM